MHYKLKIFLSTLALATALSSACSNAMDAEPTSTSIKTLGPSATPTAEIKLPDPLFQYTRAVNLLKAAHYKEAIPEFGIVLRILPNFAQAYHGRGLAYYNNEQENLALNDFNKAIELKPDYAQAYRNRGILYMNAGNFSNGTYDLEKAIDLYEASGNTEESENIRELLPGK